MRKKLKNWFPLILGYGSIILILLVIITVIAVCGGAFMHLFGFQYKSVGSIILYFVISFIIGFPIQSLIQAFPNALLAMNLISVRTGKILFVIFNTISASIILSFVDYIMKSVSATNFSILAVSFVMAVLSLILFRKTKME